MTRTLALAAGVALAVGLVPSAAHAQSALDGFNPGANNGIRAVVLQPDGKILVGGAFTALGGGTGTTARQHIGRLNADGSLDTSFNPGANDTVTALAIQPDGKILVGGDFTLLGGGGVGTAARSYIGRLNIDGSLDISFDPGANDHVDAIAVQADGKVVVGGEFTTLGGGGTGSAPRYHMGRLNADGSLDSSFDPATADAFVIALAVQPNGQILVGGCGGILRINGDGTRDLGFSPVFSGLDSCVITVALEPDGQILVGGSFTMLGGGGTGVSTRSRIGRLNADGSLDIGFDPGANEQVNTVAVHPDGKIFVGGAFTMLGGGGTGSTPRNYVGRLNPDGSLDASFNPGANNWVSTLAVQPDGKTVVAGEFTTLGGGGAGTTLRSSIGRLHSDGTLDADLDPGANGVVLAMAVQPNGKILVGGTFTTLGGGGTGTTPRSHIGRLNLDGSLDATFDPGANDAIFVLAVQPDGKILVGGEFTALGGGTGTTPRSYIGRLNPDGAIDPTFNPGANSPVWALVVQPDGKILVGGLFTMLGGGGTGATARNRIGRLNPDGTLDATFDPGASGFIGALALQPTGQILVGGAFTTLGGGGTGTTSRNNIGRLNPGGSIDASFNPGANDVVRVVALQPDGMILVGGQFTTLGGGGTGITPRSRIGRLHADGSVDTNFNPGANQYIDSFAFQPDGKILVCGSFTALGGGTGTTPRSFIGRLNPDGSVDASFNPGANGIVQTLAVQPDGKILVGGNFTTLGGGSTGTTPRREIGRLSTTGAAIQRLSVSCSGCAGSGLNPTVMSQVTWARSGSGPEVERVTFEVSSNGVTLAPATSATRVAGGWQALQALPSNANVFLRARGYYATGHGNGSGSIVESIRHVNIACPAISTTSLPVGTAGLAYSTTLIASGAPEIVNFSVTGALPAGLSLSSAGMLTGTPTQAGTYPLTVSARDLSSGCAGTRAYTLTINAPPTMALDKTALQFAVTSDYVKGMLVLVGTGRQAVRLTQSGTGTVTWTATSNQPSITITPASGSGSATLSIGIQGFPWTATTGTGTITFAFSGTTSSPGPITVTLTVDPRPHVTVGVIDTPLENSTGVTGAVPFTGWALDTFEVDAVRICRDAVPGETVPVEFRCSGLPQIAQGQIYVGNATFVDGARPDVQAAYPTFPRNSRAGWGFMVLTNMLPNQGNGTYVFYAYAFGRPVQLLDLGGTPRVTLLGTRTMTCANASATKPFGAIDTPGQGELARGPNYVNFGWALTPQTKIIPIDGSTITVLVDGLPLGTVDFNHERPDIESFFPSYRNTLGTNGAVGFRVIDTTALTNDVHTISWTVVDDRGAIEGIGSRYFTVSNGVGAATAGAMSDVARPSAVEAMATLPSERQRLTGRLGWDLSAPLVTFAPDASGRVIIRSEEVNRVELALGTSDAARYTGYLRTSEGLAPLPIGSSLDAMTGVFTWAPGVGFVGAYDLVFVRHADDGLVTRQEVRIILGPKRSGAVGLQVVIDAPRSQQDVAQPFVLGGWAADLNATIGTGIATLHAWAYPLAGGPPVFLGTASYGGARPDVAAVHGDAFRDSGFGLMVQGLAHGNYDLAVFAWSTEAAGFVPAKIVRVTVR